MRVGLSGGIGSGKSTVAAMLARRGAVVIDADAIAREVVEPGTPGLAAVRAVFGDGVIVDGRIDRPSLAAIVFADDARREALNAIVHPLVAARSAELMAAAPVGVVVVYDVPLLVEAGLGAGFDTVIIVLAGTKTRLARLQRRGMARADALARIATQASDEQRRAAADELIVNDGGYDELEVQVNEVWRRLGQQVT